MARQNPDRPEALDEVGDMPLVEAFPAFGLGARRPAGLPLGPRNTGFREREHRLWTVFDPEGRVARPRGDAGELLASEEIGEDYILGTRRDELDVEYVESWPLDRSGS